MQRTAGREVLHQIPFCIENIHKATLRFIQGGERHPDLALYGLNPLRGEIFRDSRIGKGLHQLEGTIEHVDSPIWATIGGIQKSLAWLIGRDSQARVGRTLI